MNAIWTSIKLFLSMADDPAPEPINANIRDMYIAWYAGGVSGWVYRHYGTIDDLLRIDFSNAISLFNEYDSISVHANDGMALGTLTRTVKNRAIFKI